VRPSPMLCGSCAVRSVSAHDTVPPSPVPPPRRPLERGWRNPRKGYDHLPRTRPGRCRDVRLAKRVPSVTFGPVRPSPSLCRHPGRCSIIPSTVGTQIDLKSSRRLLCGLRSSVSRALEPTYRWQPNKKLPCHYPRSRS
jgi:hypothetical protein